MASQGATLQAYVNDLVKTIEDMKDRQEVLRNQILEEEDEKTRVERELTVLADRLEKINGTYSLHSGFLMQFFIIDILVRQANEKKQLEATIIETEEAKTKVNR